MSSSSSARNWNLLLIALGYGFTVSIMASYSFKFQYAAAMFGWTSETLGYFVSLVGAVRAIYLVIILPVIIKISQRRPATAPQEETEETPLLAGITSSSTSSQSRPPHPKSLRELHSPSFDLRLARISLLVEAIAFAFMGQSPLAFTFFGMLGSVGTGFSPAIQSLAIELFAAKGENERGKLFGALSVVQAVSSQILGPAVYGFTYMHTVETYPRTIFYLSVAASVVSFVLLSFIRLPKTISVSGNSKAQPSARQEGQVEPVRSDSDPRGDLNDERE